MSDRDLSERQDFSARGKILIGVTQTSTCTQPYELGGPVITLRNKVQVQDYKQDYKRVYKGRTPGGGRAYHQA